MSLYSTANCVWGGSCPLSPVGFEVNKYLTASQYVRTTKATEVTLHHDRVLWIEREKCSTLWHEVMPLPFNVIFTNCCRGIESVMTLSLSSWMLKRPLFKGGAMQLPGTDSGFLIRRTIRNRQGVILASTVCTRHKSNCTKRVIHFDLQNKPSSNDGAQMV